MKPVIVLAVALGTLAPVGAAGSNAYAPSHSCHGRTATIVGTAGFDTLKGTSHGDVIVGLGGDDVIEGLGGNDVICGDGGADRIRGGPGDDRLFGGKDHVERGSSSGGADYTIIEGDVVSGGAGDDYLDLGFDQRQLTGTGSSDLVQLDGPSGTEIHLAPEGSVGFAVGFGRDRVVGQPALAVLGTPGPDRIWGSPYDDYLKGRGGADQIHGLGGNDVIRGGNLQAGGGKQLLDGGPGHDDVYGNGYGLTLRGGPGSDFIYTTDYGAHLSGGRGNDDIDVRLTSESCPVVSGGAGQRDDLSLEPPSKVPHLQIDVDLAGDLIDSCGSAAGIERLLLNPPLLYRDDVRWFVWGTGRDDFVEVVNAGRLEAHLRGGDDTVLGGPLDDLLDGGPGDDTADGLEGDDACPRTEHVTSCEL